MLLRQTLVLMTCSVSVFVLTGARGCGPEVPIGEQCAPGDCGPALGAPAILCDDGSTAGNTGRCIATASGTCGWEILECPPPTECLETDCGPLPPQLPGSPALECRLQGAECQWTEGDSCVPDDCGPIPPSLSYICEDGTAGGFTGRCLLGADALCDWEIRECTPGECTIEECGPAPGAANFLCADGSWGGPTGCTRSAAGSCGYGWRDCPEAVTCADDLDCASGMHCPPASGICTVGRGCGGMTCDPSVQFCERFVGGAVGSEDSFSCQPLPSECSAAPSCAACFASSSGGSVCEEDESGIQVTFFAP